MPAGYISGLFPLTNGHLLTDGEDETAEMLPAPLPVRPLPPGIVMGGLGAPAGLESLLPDSQHHLWGIRSSTAAPLALAEWDGKRWKAHTPPSSITGLASLYACDSLGRLWLSTMHWNPPAQPQPVHGYAIYDPARDTWTDYASEEDALRAAAALPGMAFLPNRNFYYNQSPVFSDGRVVFLGIGSDHPEINLAAFYDGKVWHNWSIRDVLPGDRNADFEGKPDFSPEGRLEIVLNSRYWEWTPAAGWQQTERRPKNDTAISTLPGVPRGLLVGPAEEKTGTRWLIWHDAVYAAGNGIWVKQPELSSAGSPFRHGYAIENVLRDPAGRFFFVSIAAGRRDQVVWSPPSVPAPNLSVVPASDDSVTVRLRSHLSGLHWFLWRLNGGAWSAPQTEDTLMLTALARGSYTLEVELLDRHLLASAPAAAVFRVQVAPETQIARWVQALVSGTDNEREAAVAGLVKQPNAARAALQAARPGASESIRWWIDAALQQIEEPAPAGTSRPR